MTSVLRRVGTSLEQLVRDRFTPKQLPLHTAKPPDANRLRGPVTGVARGMGQSGRTRGPALPRSRSPRQSTATSLQRHSGRVVALGIAGVSTMRADTRRTLSGYVRRDG